MNEYPLFGGPNGLQCVATGVCTGKDQAKTPMPHCSWPATSPPSFRELVPSTFVPHSPFAPRHSAPASIPSPPPPHRSCHHLLASLIPIPPRQDAPVQLLGTDSNGCCCSAGAVGLGLKINEFAYGNPASALRYMECDAELRRSNVQQAPCIGTEVCQFEIVAMPRSSPPLIRPKALHFSRQQPRSLRAPQWSPPSKPPPAPAVSPPSQPLLGRIALARECAGRAR